MNILPKSIIGMIKGFLSIPQLIEIITINKIWQNTLADITHLRTYDLYHKNNKNKCNNNVNIINKMSVVNLLCNNYINDNGLMYISKLRYLHTLIISECSNITDGGLLYLSKCENLKYLEINNCFNITDIGLLNLLSLPSNLPSSLQQNIEFLSMDECQQITDIGFKYLLKCVNLKHLNINQCLQLTDESLLYLANSLNLSQKLEHLSITNCLQITDIALSHISTLQNLTYLNIAECSQITDEGLSYLSKSSHLIQNLNYLNISFNKNITNNGLKYISELKHLEELILVECYEITVDGFEYLFQIPNIKLITIEYEYYFIKNINHKFPDHSHLILQC